MVDVSGKGETRRLAKAACVLVFSKGILERVLAGDLPKGAVLATARTAGVMAAKRTASLIPLCHPLRISHVKLEFKKLDGRRLELVAEVAAVDRTGVEMEALTAASVAALTVYDMVKAVDRSMEIRRLRLLYKEGGKSGAWRARED